VPAELPVELRQSDAFRVEVDALPGGFVCSGTLKAPADPRAALDVGRGARSVRKLLTKEQRSFFRAHAPDGIALDDLTPLGPIFVLKVRFAPEELPRPMVAEVWFYPDDTHVLELSTRCGKTEAFQSAAETRTFLASRGVDISGEQQTKTRKALQYFAAAAGKAAS
jgi:hypothetical protein